MARVSSAATAPRSRRWTINAIFACAVVVGVFAVLAVWINRQVLNTDNWTNTSSQLLADPTIEAAVGGVLVNELFSSVDVSTEIKSVLPSNLVRARLAGDGGTACARDPGRPAGPLDCDGPERVAPGQPQRAARAAADPERRQQGGLDQQRRRRPAAAPAARATRRAARPAGTADERAVEASGLHRCDRPQHRPAEARRDAASIERQHRDPALIAAEDGAEHRQGDQGPRARAAR